MANFVFTNLFQNLCCSEAVNFLFSGIFHLKGGWVGVHPYIRAALSLPFFSSFTHPNAGYWIGCAGIITRKSVPPWSVCDLLCVKVKIPKTRSPSWKQPNFCRTCPDFVEQKICSRKNGRAGVSEAAVFVVHVFQF